MATGFGLPGNAALRGLVVAAAATAVFGLPQLAMLPGLLAPMLPFGGVFVGKVAYGAALGAAVSAMSVRLALGDAARVKGEAG